MNALVPKFIITLEQGECDRQSLFMLMSCCVAHDKTSMVEKCRRLADGTWKQTKKQMVEKGAEDALYRGRQK